MSSTKNWAHRSLRLLTVAALLVTMLGVFTLSALATVTTVSIDSPTAGSPVYKKSSDTLTIQYDADGSGAGQVRFYIAGNLQATDNVTFPLTDATKDLALGAIGEGTWDIKVEAKETGQANWAADTEIGALVVDDTDPTIQGDTLTSPNGGESWAAGSVHAITWDSADITDAHLGSIPISLEFSSDGGTSYSEFATGLANSGSYNWTVPGVVTSDAMIKIVATDLAGNSVFDESATVFSIYNVDNTPPVVALTAPPDGVYVTGTAVVVSADASDPESGITQVQFQYDSGAGWTNYGAAVTVPPYSVNWDTTFETVSGTPDFPDGGAVKWQAIATNGAAVTTTSASRTVTVDNSKPTVNLDSPAASAYVRGTVTLEATATDAHSLITQVEFFYNVVGDDPDMGWVTIGTDTTSPYTYNWDTTAVADGSYDLMATATNGAGLAESDISVTGVTVDNTPPDVPVLQSPNGGEVWKIGATQPISWTGVADTNLPDNPVTLFVQPGGSWVEIDTGGGLLPVYDHPGWDWTVAGMPSPQALVKMVVTDKAGNTSEDVSDDFFTIWGADDSGPDPLTLVEPAPGEYKGTVALAALAGDSQSGIQKVEFFYSPDGTTWTSIGLGSSPMIGALGLLPKTYTADWDTTLVGDDTYAVKVVATNGVGITVQVEVGGVIVDNTAPTVSLDEPVACEYVSGTAVPVKATAADGTAGIEDVEFFYDAGAGWVSIGVDTGEPYEVAWNTGTLSGAVDLKAVATDNAGNTAEDGHSVFVGTKAANQHQDDFVGGWNLVSLQAVPGTTDVEVLLDCLVANGVMDWIQTFDENLNPLKWDPGTPVHTLTDMYDGRAYWVDMFDDAQFTFTEKAPGTGTPPSYNVVVGWNFIGFTSTTPQSPADYLGAVAPHVQAMYGWDRAGQVYYAVGAGDLTPGEGYWMALDAAGTIYP